MKHTHIGSIAHGTDGGDAYYLVTIEEGDEPAGATQDDRIKRVEQHVVQRSGLPDASTASPGRLFLSHTTVMPHPVHDDRFVVVVHVRCDC